MGYKDLKFWQFLPLLLIITILSVVLHESSHSIFAKIEGKEVKTGLGVTSFVSLDEDSNPMEIAIIAMAGPLMNLLLFLISWRIEKKTGHAFWTIAKNVNLTLFVLNILPLPGLDGWQFFKNVIKAIA